MNGNLIYKFRMHYKNDDLNYKMNEQDIILQENEKNFMNEENDGNGSEALSHDTEVTQIYSL